MSGLQVALCMASWANRHREAAKALLRAQGMCAISSGILRVPADERRACYAVRLAALIRRRMGGVARRKGSRMGKSKSSPFMRVPGLPHLATSFDASAACCLVPSQPTPSHRIPLDHGCADVLCFSCVFSDKPSRVRGRTERDLSQGGPNAVVDALHGTPRPRIRGTGKEYRDIVQPNQLMPWKKSDAQRIFLEDASAADLAVFKRISERIYSNLRHELDTARMMRELDPRGSGLLTRDDLSRVFRSINLVLSPEEFDKLVQRLHRAHSQFDRKASRAGDARTISIDFFLLVFDTDQRSQPGRPGETLPDAPKFGRAASAAISRVGSAAARVPSSHGNEQHLARVQSGGPRLAVSEVER